LPLGPASSRAARRGHRPGNTKKGLLPPTQMCASWGYFTKLNFLHITQTARTPFTITFFTPLTMLSDLLAYLSHCTQKSINLLWLPTIYCIRPSVLMCFHFAGCYPHCKLPRTCIPIDKNQVLTKAGWCYIHGFSYSGETSDEDDLNDAYYYAG